LVQHYFEALDGKLSTYFTFLSDIAQNSFPLISLS